MTYLNVLKPFARTNAVVAWRELLLSFVGFITCWVFTYQLWEVWWPAMFIPMFFGSLFIVKIFIIQHDVGHGTFFPAKDKTLRASVGYVCSIITLTPYRWWLLNHNVHHRNSGKIDDPQKGIGDVPTWMVADYEKETYRNRTLYRIYRHPIIMFIIGPLIKFAVYHRWPHFREIHGRRSIMSVIILNLCIAAVIGLMIWLVGWKAFIGIQLPMTAFASTVGVWFFFIQHQFEDSYWERSGKWTLQDSAIAGSSLYMLPLWLEWFVGAINIHYLHHLNPAIPCYNLRKAHKAFMKAFPEEYKTVPKFNIWESLTGGYSWLALFDEKSQKMLSFRQYDQMKKAS